MALPCTAQTRADAKDWVPLFNGKNLDGWIPKIAGYPLGEHYADTFRVEDGILKVSYDKYPEFSIESLNLSGCMDPKASNYKSYYVHRQDELCSR